MSYESLIPTREVRKISDQLVKLQGQVANLESASRSTQLGNSSVEGGRIQFNDQIGEPRGYIGLTDDQTIAFIATNGPPPSRPNTPALTAIIDGALAEWNGTFVDPRPNDFSHIEIHASGVGPDFIHGPSTLKGSMTTAGSFPITGMGAIEIWVRFVAYNTSKKPSDPSFTASVVGLAVVADSVRDGIVTALGLAAGAVTEAKLAAAAVTETKIAPNSISSPHIIAGGIQTINLAADSVAAGKVAADAITAREILALSITGVELAANIINAGHMMAGSVTAAKLEADLVMVNRLIVGTAGGDRVEMHPTQGIQQWLSGQRTLHIPPSGSAKISGEVVVGQGVGVGPTIVLDPAPSIFRPALLMYPASNTSDIFVFESNISERPGGTAAGMHIYSMNNGGYNGLSLQAWSTNVWLGQAKPDGSEIGGIVKLQQTGQAVISSGGTRPAQLFLEGAGGVTILETDGRDLYFETGNGSALRLFDDGVAQLVSNGAVKAFVIDHPTDPDRLLVHGCTESPDAMVTYEGTATIVGYRAEVTLPAYFEGLVRSDSRSSEAWFELPDEPEFDVPEAPKQPRNRERAVAEKVSLRRQNSRARRSAGPFPEKLYRAAASPPKDGRFRISSDAPDGTIVHWRVTAARKIAGGFEVEPLRSAVQVGGEPDSPYRFIVPTAA